MIRTHFSKIRLLFLLSGIFLLCSCSDDTKEPEHSISYDALPSAAKEFLNKFFYGYEIIKVEEENDQNIIIYEVELQDNYEIVFNEEGEWQQVAAPEKMTIPGGIVPENIQAYLTENFSGYGVNVINTTGQGYKVKLVTGLNLYFNMAGEVINIENDY
ncbi:MAG: PepSY-like domain-containing protein [Muribaculaceae bacterium]|nr:PepSY-like domain-containing protein [Muribaculaceae bacterium]